MKKYFNSNEKLEYCTVDVTENGQITIATQPYHAPELERLGCPPNPTHSIRGRVTMSYDRKEFIFAPYAEGARKPTYQKQVIVGSTTLAVTEDKVKISFMVPRHLEKRLMLLYVQSEIDEVKRRLETDVYDMLVKGTPSNLPLYGEALQTSLPTNKENTPEALPIEGELSEGLRGSVAQEGGDA